MMGTNAIADAVSGLLHDIRRAGRQAGIAIAGVALPWAALPVAALLLRASLIEALVLTVLLSALLVVYAAAAARYVAGAGRRPGGPLRVALAAAAVYAAAVAFGDFLLYLPGVVAVLALLSLPAGAAWTVVAGVSLAEIPLVLLIDPDPGGAMGLTAALSLPVSAVLQFGVLRYVRLERELRAVRARLSEAAVDHDRMRVARELHDLLGQTLTAITLKTELAAALVDADRRQAAQELREACAFTDEASEEVKAVVRGRRTLDVGAEVSSAVSLLELSGAGCVVRVRLDEVDAEVGNAAGWVVREATTNIIKHSAATSCVIELEEVAGRVVLLIWNDGVPPGRELVWGSGLRGLSRRVARMRGELAVGREGADGFAVRVDMPAVPELERAAAGDSRTAG